MDTSNFVIIKRKDGSFYLYRRAELFEYNKKSNKKERIGTIEIEMPNCKIERNNIIVLPTKKRRNSYNLKI